MRKSTTVFSIFLLSVLVVPIQSTNWFEDLVENLKAIWEGLEGKEIECSNVTSTLVYFLYYPRNQLNSIVIIYDEESQGLKTSNTANGTFVPLTKAHLGLTLGFNVFLPTKIIAHGWVGSSSETWVVETVKKYQQQGLLNVLTLDWSYYANSNYPNAVCYVRKVAKVASEALLLFAKNYSLNLKNTHLVGFSLGAQLWGLAGKDLKRSGHTVGRITGLDPAGFLFCMPGLAIEERRLAVGDAYFVDIVHTSSWSIFGCEPHIGDVDFYVNCNAVQPGCVVSDFTQQSVCTHKRSTEIFINSIQYGNCSARLCTSCPIYGDKSCENTTVAIVGEHVNPFVVNGSYYLQTEAKSPLCSN